MFKKIVLFTEKSKSKKMTFNKALSLKINKNQKKKT